MAKEKVVVSIEKEIILAVDRLIAKGIFPNRSKAIEAAVQEKLARLSHDRLARECAKLDPQQEKAFAEEGMSAELEQWPEY